MNTEIKTDRRPSIWRRIAGILKRALMMELRIYTSIARLVGRRHAIPRNAVGLSYHKPVLTILIIFIVLSAVEIPIIDLIVHQWPPVRIFFLILGIWGVTWMLGLLCAYLVRPHTVGADGIQVRNPQRDAIVHGAYRGPLFSRSPKGWGPKAYQTIPPSTGAKMTPRVQTNFSRSMSSVVFLICTTA